MTPHRRADSARVYRAHGVQKTGERRMLLADRGSHNHRPRTPEDPMNADLTLARLAEVAAAHDDHAHDGTRPCLLSGDIAVIHEAAGVTDEPLGAGIPARRTP